MSLGYPWMVPYRALLKVPTFVMNVCFLTS